MRRKGSSALEGGRSAGNVVQPVHQGVALTPRGRYKGRKRSSKGEFLVQTDDYNNSAAIYAAVGNFEFCSRAGRQPLLWHGLGQRLCRNKRGLSGGAAF